MDSRGHKKLEKNTVKLKKGLAQMLKGGVIMDVVNAEQAKIAEDAGAVAVMALERVPADIRKDGGVARMSDPRMIKEIMEVGKRLRLNSRKVSEYVNSALDIGLRVMISVSSKSSAVQESVAFPSTE